MPEADYRSDLRAGARTGTTLGGNGGTSRRSRRIPEATVARLPVYLRSLVEGDGSAVITQAQVDVLLNKQETNHRFKLAEILITKGYMTPEILEKELREYNKESERLASEIAITFSNLSHQKIIKTFIDLILMMFTQFGKQDIIIERCETGKEKVRLFRWVISQKIEGQDVGFNCLLSVPPKLLLQIASTMLDEHVSIADELALDATKEFINIANGTACAKLSEDGVSFKLMPPEVYETTTTPYPLQANDVVCVHLASQDSKLEVAFEF